MATVMSLILLLHFFYGIKKSPSFLSALRSSGDQTRTDDLQVMSPTSYQLLHPAMFLFLDAASRVVFYSFSSGDQTRTDDLRVMSPTSYQLLHPALFLVIQR